MGIASDIHRLMKKKEASDLKENKEGYMGWFGGNKGKREMM